MTEFDFESDIEAITKNLKKHHTGKKKEEQALQDSRDEFFAAATERLELQPRATRTIMIPAKAGKASGMGIIICTDEEVETYVHRFYPEWKIVKIEDEPFQVLVEEDPAWMKYTYISKDRKTIFQRGITQSSPYLDDASLKEDDPGLWLRITTCLIEEELRAFASSAAQQIGGEVIGQMQVYIEAHIDEWPRILKSFETLSEEDYAVMQDYIIPGKLSYRLESPRKPKREELE